MTGEKRVGFVYASAHFTQIGMMLKMQSGTIHTHLTGPSHWKGQKGGRDLCYWPKDELRSESCKSDEKFYAMNGRAPRVLLRRY